MSVLFVVFGLFLIGCGLASAYFAFPMFAMSFLFGGFAQAFGIALGLLAVALIGFGIHFLLDARGSDNARN